MKKVHDSIPYVCLYREYLEVLAPFTHEEIGCLVMAMLRYSQFGEVPEFSGNERYIWPMLKSKIDLDKDAYQLKCEKNRRNGKKGGRPANKPELNSETDGFSEEPKKANQNQNQNQSQNQSQNHNQNENKSESQKENKKPAAALAAEKGSPCDRYFGEDPFAQELEALLFRPEGNISGLEAIRNTG